MNMKLFDEILTEYCKQNKVRGLTAAIHDDGKSVYTFCYGVTDQSNKVKINSTTLFPIGSISKIFAAVSVMILKEEGKLDLDAPVSNYIPQFKMQDQRYKDITVRMLLNHSSGLEGSAVRGKYTSNTSDRDYLRGLIEYYATASLKDTPGNFSVYCNDGFCLAELLIEQVANMSFVKFVYQRICIPCKLERTDFPVHEFREGHFCLAASGMGRDYGQEYVNGIGSGGIYSTAEDLCTFFDTFIANTLISHDSQAEMNANQVAQGLLPGMNTAFKYGLGWDSVEIENLKAMGVKAYGKSGSTYGFKCHALVAPNEGVSCAVLTCADQGKGSQITQRLAGEYLQMKLKQSISTNQLTDLENMIEETQISGLYGNNERTLKLYFSEGKLIVEERKEHAWQLISDDFMKISEGYCSKEIFYGYQNPCLNFISTNQQIYMVMDYDDYAFKQVRQRVLFSQKIEPVSKDNWFYQQKNRQWIISNEHLEQRRFGIFPIILEFDYVKGYESILLNPYPLRVMNNFEAEPFLEIPGDYSREMMHLKVLDKDCLQLGQYIYTPLERIKPLVSKEYFIRETLIHWFIIENEIDTIQLDGRARFVIVDARGECVFDSDLSSKLPVASQGCWIGILGEVGSKISIICEEPKVVESIEEVENETNKDDLLA